MKDQPVNRGGIYARYFLKPETRPNVTRVTETVTKMAAALPKVGRPRKATKLTPAEKQRAYRERKKHGQAG